MSKRYQVFVSSTYEDLIEERKGVMQSLLESECIPAGMEMFPASDNDAWTLIKKVINESDYYLLILAGRYGSTNSDGMGYTEMEYRYALKIGKPVISFLHKDPDELIVNKTDKDPEKIKRLESFRNLAKNKVVKFWESPAELSAIVGRSIENMKKEKPSSGWIKGTISSDDKSGIVDVLNEKIEKLKRDINYTKEPVEERPEMLVGSTYKVRTPLSEHALYVTINDIEINEGDLNQHRRPYELLISSKNMDNFQWVVAFTKIISMCFRKGIDVSEITKELNNVYAPAGGYFKKGGKYMPSLVAEIGDVITAHYEKLAQ